MQNSVMLPRFVISPLMCVLMVWSQANDEAQTVSVPIRHSLPDVRIKTKFGSSENGSCQTVIRDSTDHRIYRGSICNDTSVLNNGVIPALSNVSNDSSSLWAAQLLTMRHENYLPIILSFEVENQVYNCMELAVFNCPDMNVNALRIDIYRDTLFRPRRQNTSSGYKIKENHMLSNTSCDYLVKFYVSFTPVNSSYFNIEFPAHTSENYVFLGEVSFLTGADNCEQCPPELIKTTYHVQNSKGVTNEDRTSSNFPSTSSTGVTPQKSDAPLTVAVATMVVIFLAILVVVFFVIVFVCLRNRKQEKKVDNVQCLEDNMKERNKEPETEFSNIVHKTTFVNSEQLKESVPASSIPIPDSDGIYSNADEVQDVATTSFTGKKNNSNQVIGQQYYVKQNPSYEADFTTLNTRDSVVPISSNEVDHIAVEGTMYAVPNKKCKTKQSSVSNMSKAEFEASTEPLCQSISDHDNDNTLYENVDPAPPLQPSNLEGSSNNLLEHDITENGADKSTSDVQQISHSEEGILDTNAIYAEPLNPSSTDKVELDADQNIYESIYSEPLKPSLFMQETPTECQAEKVESENLYPYSSIYTVPDTDLTNKPLLVSAKNVNVTKHLGNGNFGEVVLAETVDLTPQQLQLESQAPFALVAVKRLKTNASEATKELFEKEVKFMSRLSHPNVVRTLGVCTDEESPFIMMEYMMNGDLYQYLKEFNQVGEGEYINIKSISVSTLTKISLQIASAMQYLASLNFVHRDLATRNCLVGSKNTVKVSDFGMSRSLYESHYYIISGHAILPIRWMATECFYGRFSAKTDVWAFGVTVWEIFTLAKEQPYDHLQDMELVEDAIKGPSRTLLERPAKCPQEVYDVMKACWVHDPTQRPTFDELYEMLSKEN